LPIIRELLRSEGGEISIEPYEMGGVRFRVIMPQS
jgi:signal transduction histidine kinase